MKVSPLSSLFLCGFLCLARLGGEPLWIAGEGGVYRVELDDESGRLSEPVLACAYNSGSYLAIHPELDVLYSSYADEEGAGYASFKPSGDGRSLELQSVQRVASGTAHLAVSANGRFLAGAHYSEGVNYVLELEADGSISNRIKRLAQEGSGPKRPQRQARPHWVSFAGGDSLLHSVDLGTDEIWTYAVGDAAESVVLKHKVKFPLGTGPRHMALPEQGGVAYVSGELNLVVNSLFYDATSGRFSPLQYVSAVNAEDQVENSNLSEIQRHKSGRFVYTAVRGLNRIVAFSVDPETGLLQRIESEDARVNWPRNFTISDSGKWLIVAGQHSGEVRVFAIDPESGELDPVDTRIEIGNPVCVRAWGRL
ncbi:lactonase family protein [Pelagicoccus sp. SDUM812005]|uniref:lactonase family protein n=1 Tax=Pelagicoccus sp. SDUM812005 TaxID=3041257 RepID=UPI0028101B14|nr:lactonase family protein [Pelagicoccus sp. SDUM812005]MDQ8179543.1 lactonase family protein [Pelagicoccus sp. SDUM812005]